MKVIHILFLSTALVTLGAPDALAQTTPPFNGGSGGGTDLLNDPALLNGGRTPPFNPSTATQSGLEQQAQDGIGQAGGIVDQIGNIGDQIGNIDGIGDIGNLVGNIGSIGSQISGRLGQLFSRFNLEALMGVLNIDLGQAIESAAGGLLGGDSPLAGNPAEPDADADGGGLWQIRPKPPKPEGEAGSLTERGALMLPDIDQARAAIANGQTSQIEEFFGAKTGGDGSPVIKQDLESLLMSSTAREVGEATTLSAEGQQQLRANAEAANSALETSSQLAQDSEGQDVSQNILRNLSGQMQASQQTGTLLAVDAQMRARDDSLRNILLSNTLDEIQGANIAQRRIEASAYSAAITQGSQFILPGFGRGGEGNPTAGGDTE